MWKHNPVIIKTVRVSLTNSNSSRCIYGGRELQFRSDFLNSLGAWKPLKTVANELS